MGCNMYKESRHERIGMTEAKRKFSAGEDVFMWGRLNMGDKEKFILVPNEEAAIAGNVWEYRTTLYPNELRLDNGTLRYVKKQDGSMEVSIIDDYDVYDAQMNKEDVTKLLQFIASPYMLDEDHRCPACTRVLCRCIKES